MNEKKPIAVICIADQNNVGYASLMINSLRKFHDWPVILVTNETDKKKLPKNVILEDLTPYLQDPQFFYRATPILAERFMDEYESILKIDADSIITGDLNYVKDTTDYDVGTVMNWNRTDPEKYGYVQGWGILPAEYFNCGFVMMRSKTFVHHWKVLCFTPQFDRLQYREQDLLNILCYYGNYNVRCFDFGDGVAQYHAWHGLVAKGELLRAEVRGDEIVIPKGEGDRPFPTMDVTVKVIHAAGGNVANKMNYHTWTPDLVADRLDILTSQSK